MQVERVEVGQEVRVAHIVDLALDAGEEKRVHGGHALDGSDFVSLVRRGQRSVGALDAHGMHGNELGARIDLDDGLDDEETRRQAELVVDELLLAHDHIRGIEVGLVPVAPSTGAFANVLRIDGEAVEEVRVANVEDSAVIEDTESHIPHARVNSKNTHVRIRIGCCDEDIRKIVWDSLLGNIGIALKSKGENGRSVGCFGGVHEVRERNTDFGRIDCDVGVEIRLAPPPVHQDGLGGVVHVDERGEESAGGK